MAELNMLGKKVLTSNARGQLKALAENVDLGLKSFVLMYIFQKRPWHIKIFNFGIFWTTLMYSSQQEPQVRVGLICSLGELDHIHWARVPKIGIYDLRFLI